MRLPILAAMLLLGTAITTNVTGAGFAFDTSAAQAIYPDPHGYVIVETLSLSPTTTCSQIPVDAAGIQDVARGTSFAAEGIPYPSESGIDLLLRRDGQILPVTKYYYHFGNPYYSTDTTQGDRLAESLYTGSYTLATWESFGVRMGVYHYRRTTYQGFLIVTDDGPAALGIRSFIPDAGYGTPNNGWYFCDGGPACDSGPITTGTYVVQAAGPSRVAGNRGILIGKFGTLPQIWRIAESGMTTEAAVGYGATPLAIAESASGEVVSLSVDAGRLVARSSTAGSTDLGASALAAPLTSWFDELGNYHAISGSLTDSTTVPVHVWRSAAGVWQVTDVASYLDPIAAVWGVDIDITPGGALGIAVSTYNHTTETQIIRLVRFLEGNWTNTVVATSTPGILFGNLAAGTTGDGQFLVIYKTNSVAKSTSTWDVQALDGLAAADEEQWSLYR